MPFWNPWHGCTKCSPGCAHCYVYRRDAMYGKDASVVTKTAAFDLPVRKDRNGHFKLQPSDGTVYTCFTSDFFHPAADAWRAEAWAMMGERSDLDFYFITKRPERIADHLPENWGSGWDNVHICCTCENQEQADRRLPVFLALPLRHRSIIHEPMLVYWPNVTQGGTINTNRVMIEDFFPTILDMAEIRGYRTIQDIDGISFADLLKKPQKHRERTIIWHYPNAWTEGVSREEGYGAYAALMMGDYHLIYFWDTQEIRPQESVEGRFSGPVRFFRKVSGQEHKGLHHEYVDGDVDDTAQRVRVEPPGYPGEV